MRFDWNSLLGKLKFRNFSKDYFPKADCLVDYLNTYATMYNIKITCNKEVINIKKRDGFEVLTKDGTLYKSKVLILSNGFNKENIPQVPGIDLADTYATHDSNPVVYQGKSVLIIGTGNSGFEVATSLLDHASEIHLLSPEPLQTASQTHYVGSLRALNTKVAEAYHLKSQSAILTASIDKISKVGGVFKVDVKYNLADSEAQTYYYDKVISCCGFLYEPSIFDESCLPQLCEKKKYPLQDYQWQSINIPDLYFAGTLTHIHDFGKASSGFVHGFRYNCRALHEYLLNQYEGVPLPYETVEACPDYLTAYLVKRFNTTDALYLQPGSIADALVVSKDMIKHYKNLSMIYFKNSPLLKNEEHYYLLSLEYGTFQNKDTFATERVSDHQASYLSQYFHPIIRRYNKQQLVAEYHIRDTLRNKYDEPVIMNFFHDFLSRSLKIPPHQILPQNMTVQKIITGKTLQCVWHDILSMKAPSFVPFGASFKTLLASDLKDDLYGVYSGRIGSDVWDFKVARVCHNSFHYELVGYSRGMASSLGALRIIIKLENGSGVVVSWTTSYSNDLCSKLVTSFEQRSEAILEQLANSCQARM